MQAQSFTDTYNSCEASWNLAIDQNLPDYNNLKADNISADQLLTFLQENLLGPLNQGVSVLETLNLDCTDIAIAQNEGIGALNLYGLFGNSRLSIYQEMAKVYAVQNPGNANPYNGDYHDKAQSSYTFGNNMLQTIIQTRLDAISSAPIYSVIRVGSSVWSVEAVYYYNDAWTGQDALGEIGCDNDSISEKQAAERRCQGEIDLYLANAQGAFQLSLSSVQQSLDAWNAIAPGQP